MKITTFYSMILVMIIYGHCAFAVIYQLPEGNSRLVGENIQITIPKGNKFPLEYFAAQFQMGLSNMLEANPDVDVYLPAGGSKIIIPQQLILPDTPHEGIIINSAEMRLYFYPKGSRMVIVFPIGIGELGKVTPTNWITSVQRKKYAPTWTPTKAMHVEYAKSGRTLPTIFPAGPDNPMGLYALYVGRLYALHGTNANFGIGLRVSHGCVRLRDEDIKYLFNHVPIGTRVQFINEPVKISIEPNGSRYLEVHDPLSLTEEQFYSNAKVPINLSSRIIHLLVAPSIDQNAVYQTMQRRSGMPKNITVLSTSSKTSMK